MLIATIRTEDGTTAKYRMRSSTTARTLAFRAGLAIDDACHLVALAKDIRDAQRRESAWTCWACGEIGHSTAACPNH